MGFRLRRLWVSCSFSTAWARGSVRATAVAAVAIAATATSAAAGDCSTTADDAPTVTAANVVATPATATTSLSLVCMHGHGQLWWHPDRFCWLRRPHPAGQRQQPRPGVVLRAPAAALRDCHGI